MICISLTHLASGLFAGRTRTLHKVEKKTPELSLWLTPAVSAKLVRSPHFLHIKWLKQWFQIHWHSKMSTQRRAETCKMLQNPSAANTKANIHNAGTMLEFRKLSSIITGEFTHPEPTMLLFLNQNKLVLLQSEPDMVLTSQSIPVPGLCVVVTRTNAGMAKEQGLGNGNASLLCADTELLQQGRRAQQRSPCDLGAHISSSHLKLVELESGSSSHARPEGHGTKGWSKMIPDGNCWYSLWGELNCSLTSQLLCLAKTVSATVKRSFLKED